MKILIAGGSGLVGRHLSELLIDKGHEVRWLSRSQRQVKSIQSFLWDPQKKWIDEKSFQGIDAVVNLSGASIIDKKWTSKRKQEIIKSRVGTNRLLHQYADTIPGMKQFISASAIGFYGDRPDEILDEGSGPGNQDEFLVSSTMAWENSVFEGADQKSYALSAVRLGMVLSNEGGAYVELRKPIPFFIAPYFGNGRQSVSWVHITDATRIFVHILEHGLSGPYNAVAPDVVSNRAFIKQLRKVVQPFAIEVPAFAFILRFILGERAAVLLDDTTVSCTKIQSTGFQFRYPDLTGAIKELEMN